MKTIYLLTETGWSPFDYDDPKTKDELSQRGITIGDRASIGNRASIGDGASIGNGASIGYRASIGYGASIGDGASIGYGASIGDEASIGNEASIGDEASIVKSIYITGSQHTVNWYGTGEIHIGCYKKSISTWKRVYKEVGKDNGYTKDEIKEYYGYIKICEDAQKTINTTEQ